MTVALAALVIAGGLAIALKLYDQYSAPLYEVTNVQVGDLNDHGVTVTWNVRTPPGQGATCTVRAPTREGELVGEASVVVPPGGPDQTTVRMTYTLATTKRPFTGQVPGCGP